MTEPWLWALSVGAALAYGLVFVERPPSASRTLVKCVAVGALAVIAYWEGGGAMLAIALAFCALGMVLIWGYGGILSLPARLAGNPLNVCIPLGPMKKLATTATCAPGALTFADPIQLAGRFPSFARSYRKEAPGLTLIPVLE
ncbi:MAG: hypothetical protein K6V36_16575 [Anaerolineae bacterium]|nr:hypothetical protein [Anaerolineae bacterium]